MPFERLLGKLKRDKAQTSPSSLYPAPLNVEQKEIRLLTIHPGKPLKCTLHPITLTTAPLPPYETISYCWGDPKSHSTLLINNLPTRVPRSSHNAITRVQLPHKDRVIWIDAICINQADIDERAQQVTLMKDIYTNSQGTLIYLGEADRTTRSAVRSVELAVEEMRGESDGFRGFRDLVLDEVSGDKRARVGIQAKLDLKAVEMVFRRPWFQRVWVLQETLLSPRNTCLCGEFEIPFIDLLRFAVWIRHKAPYIDLDGETLAATTSYRLFVWWVNQDREQKTARLNHFETVEGLLMFSLSRKTTDERDRIFGLLGLYRGEVPPRLQPNYNVPLVDLLCDAMRYALVDRQGKLEVSMLGMVNLQTQDELTTSTFPSWIPRFDRDIQFPSPLGKHFQASGFEDPARGPTDGGPLPYDPSQVPAGCHTLEIPGFKVDRIAAATAVLTLKMTDSPKELEQWLWSVYTLIAQSSREMDIITNYEMHTSLIAGTNAEGQSATVEDVLALDDFRYSFPVFGFPKPIVESSSAKEIASWRFHEALIAACTGRCFFLTVDGKVGLGPALVKEGDDVVVFRGGIWPFIIRWEGKGEGCKLIGNCYLEGGMYGELVKGGKERSFSLI